VCVCVCVCVHTGASTRQGKASETADRVPNTIHTSNTATTTAQGRQEAGTRANTINNHEFVETHKEARTRAIRSGQPKKDSENIEAVMLPVLFSFILFLQVFCYGCC
jgi:hypothetical protein